MIWTTVGVGGSSLLLFYLFLFFGAFSPVDLGMSDFQALAFDAFLSLLFFMQHSILVRRSVRARIEQWIGEVHYGAFYTLSSGCVLLLLVLLWQKTFLIASAGKLLYGLLRALSVLSILGFYWAVRSLRSFDPFGIGRIILADAKKEPRPARLTVRGAYLWMRHPLYFFSLLMIWSIPELTADRLLFNLLWTLWIVIATRLEERDLVAEFGGEYEQYRNRVPMLIPYRFINPLKHRCNQP